jgi:phage gp36-like protein
VILSAGGLKRLVQITDYDNDGEEDSGVVDGALLEAEGIVNSFARKRFEVPLSPVPDTIKDITANIAVYILKSRRDALTEADVLLQKDRMKWLKDLSSGATVPGTNPTPGKSPLNSPSATARPSSKAVGRDNLKGYT